MEESFAVKQGRAFLGGQILQLLGDQILQLQNFVQVMATAMAMMGCSLGLTWKMHQRFPKSKGKWVLKTTAPLGSMSYKKIRPQVVLW